MLNELIESRQDVKQRGICFGNAVAFVALALLFTFAGQVYAQTKCVDGMAGEFRCKNIDLLSHMSLTELGDIGRAADNWGWKDPQTGRYYALWAPGRRRARSGGRELRGRTFGTSGGPGYRPAGKRPEAPPRSEIHPAGQIVSNSGARVGFLATTPAPTTKKSVVSERDDSARLSSKTQPTRLAIDYVAPRGSSGTNSAGLTKR